MTWGKNDDGLHEHDKFRNLSATAIGIWTVTRSWSSQNETDGFIPADIVRRKVSQHARGHRSPKVAQELVDAGLWDVGIGGYMIHDFADWNETKAQKQARRTGDARRQRDAREKLARSSRDPRDEPTRSSGRKIADKRVPSRRESQPLEVEVETEPPTVVHGVVDIPLPRTSQHIIASWIDHYPGKPPSRVLGQLAAEVNKLLLEGYAWDVVNAAVAEWHRRSLHPSALASVLDQMQRPAGTRVGSTVDDRVRNTIAIGERIAARMQEGSVS